MSLVLNIVLKLLYCEFITRSTRKCLLLQLSHIYFFFALHLLPQYILIWLYDRKKFISWTFSFSLDNIASHRVNWFYFILCCKFPLHSIFLLINSFIASSRDVFFHYPTGCCFHFEIPFNILIKKCLLSFFSILTAAAATESERKNQKQQNLMLWKCKLCNNFMHLCLSVHSSLYLSLSLVAAIWFHFKSEATL